MNVWLLWILYWTTTTAIIKAPNWSDDDDLERYNENCHVFPFLFERTREPNWITGGWSNILIFIANIHENDYFSNNAASHVDFEMDLLRMAVECSTNLMNGWSVLPNDRTRTLWGGAEEGASIPFQWSSNHFKSQKPLWRCVSHAIYECYVCLLASYISIALRLRCPLVFSQQPRHRNDRDRKGSWIEQ